MRLVAVPCLLALTFAAGAALAQSTPTSVSVETRDAETAPDPIGEATVRYLMGLAARHDAGSRPGALAPSFFVAWQRAYAALWRGETSDWTGGHPLATAALVLAAKGEAGAWAIRPAPWTALRCWPSGASAVRLVDLARARDGAVLLGIEVRCAAGDRQAAASTVRLIRLVARVTALGKPLSATAVLTTAAAGGSRAWPLGAAALQAPARPLVRVADRWIAIVRSGSDGATDPAAGDAGDAGDADAGVGRSLAALPGPTRAGEPGGADHPATGGKRSGTTAVWLFGDDGIPSAVLVDGAVEATTAERAAAAVRLPTERHLPSARALAVPLLEGLGPDVVVHRPQKQATVVLTLLVGRRDESGAIVDAGVAAWRWQSSAPARRVDFLLPRTASEGVWRCDPSEDAKTMRCVVAQPAVPGGDHLASRTLALRGERYEVTR